MCPQRPRGGHQVCVAVSVAHSSSAAPRNTPTPLSQWPRLWVFVLAVPTPVTVIVVPKLALLLAQVQLFLGAQCCPQPEAGAWTGAEWLPPPSAQKHRVRRPQRRVEEPRLRTKGLLRASLPAPSPCTWLSSAAPGVWAALVHPADCLLALGTELGALRWQFLEGAVPH